MSRTYEYQARYNLGLAPRDLREGRHPHTQPVDIEYHLNKKDKEGWEYVGQYFSFWVGEDIPQTFVVFRRPFNSSNFRQTS